MSRAPRTSAPTPSLLLKLPLGHRLPVALPRLKVSGPRLAGGRRTEPQLLSIALVNPKLRFPLVHPLGVKEIDLPRRPHRVEREGRLDEHLRPKLDRGLVAPRQALPGLHHRVI